jgi:hypothetical protein
VTQATVKEALDILRGAVMIVYPMGLPPHEPIRHEFENNEDLSGKQVQYMLLKINLRGHGFFLSYMRVFLYQSLLNK